jgi:hypothetical protein
MHVLEERNFSFLSKRCHLSTVKIFKVEFTIIHPLNKKYGWQNYFLVSGWRLKLLKLQFKKSEKLIRMMIIFWQRTHFVDFYVQKCFIKSFWHLRILFLQFYEK